MFRTQDKSFFSVSMSINQEVKEIYIFEYPKRLQLPEKINSFLSCWIVLLLHDGKYSDTIDLFEMCYAFLHLIISSLSVLNTRWDRRSATDLPERKIRHSQNMKFMPNDSCLHFFHDWSLAFKPVH